MREWDQPHWSGRPQPKPDGRRRLKPNVFARVARLCAQNSNVVFIALLFFTALAVSVAALTLRFDPETPPRIVLDARTRVAQEALERNFPGIETSFVAQIELADMDAARAKAVATAATLSGRTDLFANAFVPGTGAFYTKYAILFRDAAGVEDTVALALGMQPLYQALGSAPDLSGLATLVSEIGRAVSQGRSPPGLSGLLLAASAVVEGEIEGQSRPIDWPGLAGLSATVESKRWFVIATPLPEMEREAAAFAAATATPDQGLEWYFPPDAQAGDTDTLRDLIIPAGLALLVLLAILGLGLGAMKFAIPVVLTAFATLCLTAGVACLIAPELDAVIWSFAPACLAPALLFSIVLVLAHIQSRLRGAKPLTAIMLAAHRSGLLLVTLAVISEVFWFTWFFRQLPSLAETAAIGAIAIAVAFALSLTLLPAALGALDRGGEVGRHWLDRGVAQPSGPNFRNGRQIVVLLVVAASVFCGVFVPGLRFGDAPRRAVQTAPLDTPVAQDAVHFLVESGDPARRAVEELAKLPQTGAIRWIEQFLPTDAERKLHHLRQLEGFLTDLPASYESSAETLPGATFTALEAGLRQISDDPATAPDLREASHRLRRAFSLYANPELPAPGRVKALEAALFSDLGNLSSTAGQLAGLGAPTLADLDQALRQRFVSANGLWRIEVLPKPGVRRLAFAGAMRKFSAQAAGAPVVALARSEIMHHETAIALAFAFAAAAAAILLYLRDVWDWITSLVPLLFGISLSAAVAAATAQIVLPSAFAAAITAMPLCLSMSILLILWGRQRRESATTTDTSFRAAVLPPLTFLGVAAPLMLSENSPVAAFGQASVLFLAATMAVNFIVVPQASAWADALRR
ncbi:MAG: hypothetical protein H7X89_00375 [Rhizobiales bacterium]|nr:hypothetical protein [Hyphomicrobiales bacterium]